MKEQLEKRNVPKLVISHQKEERNRQVEAIRDLLCREMYGYMPSFPLINESVIRKADEHAYGDKAISYQMEIRVRSPYEFISFPASLTIPKQYVSDITNQKENIVRNVQGKLAPLFLYFSFTPQIADGLGEEIIDSGYAIANIYYEDVAADKEDNFMTGVGRFCRRNPYDSWGKLAMWAWSGSRVLDYIVTLGLIDEQRMAVMGHSRLGKAALYAGAMDSRFTLTVSNDSGAGGAAILRGKSGEHIENLSHPISRLWFCGNFLKYADRESELPFDTHFLTALLAPRRLYVASASDDAWADPESEFLFCVAGNEAYESFGQSGLIAPELFKEDRYPLPGEVFHEGYIGYHMRKGTHFLSRWDWQQVIAYRNQHGC